MQPLARRALAEGIGTFGFVLIGCFSVIANVFPTGRYETMGIAFAHAVGLGLFITITMGVSGGHLNPAVTLGFLSTKRIDGRSAGVYILAQVVGAVCAALLLKLILPAGVTRTGTLGTPSMVGSLLIWQGIAVEAVLTFVLMSAVYGTIVAQDPPRFGGFGVGVALLGIVLVGGPLTGAAVNPARAFGPALVSGSFLSWGAYWIGPIIGAVLAAQLWERLLMKRN